MKAMGHDGVMRGKKPKATIPDTSQSCPPESVNRQIDASAPNVLGLGDVT